MPRPRAAVAIRIATPADMPFIDSLQKLHSKMVGWMAQQLEGNPTGLSCALALFTRAS